MLPVTQAFNTPKVKVPETRDLEPKRAVDTLKPKQRQQIADFKTVLDHLNHIDSPSANKRVNAFIQQFNDNKLPNEINNSLKRLRGKKADSAPNRATLYRWQEKLTHYSNGNAQALTKQHKGKQRIVWGWEHKAIELYNIPSKPEYATVAYWLRNDFGYPEATNSRVHSYLKTLPETLGKQSKHRMGKDFYRHNLAPHKIRDNTVLPVGFGYEGDGHTVDAYIAHPSTGNLWRPEITVWIDVRSRYIVGWYISEAESAISTLFALSHAIIKEDHVPAVLFLDNGSGFKARMMNDKTTGYFSRLSITPNWALPGNSKGKGLVEGFFKLYRNRLDKRYQTYCGDDMAPEINRRLSGMITNGKRILPTYKDYCADVAKFIDECNNNQKEVLGDIPSEFWKKNLEQVKVHIHADALIQPRELRTVRKWRITLHNRIYESAELAMYNGKQVMIEYSLHFDNEIRVLDDEQRLICIATLVGKVDRLPDSRIEEYSQKREKGQRKRLEIKIEESRQRAQPVLGVVETTANLVDMMGGELEKLETEKEVDAYDCVALFENETDKTENSDLDVADMFGLS